MENLAEVAAPHHCLAEEMMGSAASEPVSIRRLVVPRWHVNMYLAAGLLHEYVKHDCPVAVGRDRTIEELEAGVKKGPHISALALDKIDQMQVEAREREKQVFAKIFNREKLKENLPSELKLSPLAMIPHKSRKYP